MKQDSIQNKFQLKEYIGPILFGVFGIGSMVVASTFAIIESIKNYDSSYRGYEIAMERLLSKYGDINKDGRIDGEEEYFFYKRLSESLAQKGFVLSEDGVARSKKYGYALKVTDLERLTETEDFFK